MGGGRGDWHALGVGERVTVAERAGVADGDANTARDAHGDAVVAGDADGDAVALPLAHRPAVPARHAQRDSHRVAVVQAEARAVT